ncbi:hypothetical protein [Actinokineospora globicatena]|uniref:hypothetical protein n=1 Tax=Actinokineospora globicatena TaxID=103729 RepID=UPI0020A5A9EB|nr:hypothetical protein [Actinokineospora globicatena]MCP2304403.1 hypothetical protein [Actinokineospora globicatena]GLW85102.1 hypothetical protein Aglo02_27420 [Actinokineospora globicatena]
MTRPLEIRLASLLLVGSAVAFVVFGLVRQDWANLRFPAILGVLGLLAGVSAFVGKYAGAVLAVVVLAAVAHTAIALSLDLVWVRVGSGVLAAAHVYAGVLVLTRPARVFMGKVSGDES